MSTLVASAFVSSNDPRWPEGVPELAIERHQEWCESQGVDYMLITDQDMEPYRKISEWPNSWGLGTLAKFVAVKRFLHRFLVSGFDRLVWMDLDCIPGPEATIEAIRGFGDNGITVGGKPLTENSLRESDNLFQVCKFAFHLAETFHPVSSHLMCLSGGMANDLMRWVEHGNMFGSTNWLEVHNDDVKVAVDTASGIWKGDSKDINVETVGNDEAYIEGWVQKRLDSFGWYEQSLVSNYDSGVQGLFTHYYGDAKRLIPEALA